MYRMGSSPGASEETTRQRVPCPNRSTMLTDVVSSETGSVASSSGSDQALPARFRQQRTPSGPRYSRSDGPVPSRSASRTRRASNEPGRSNSGAPDMVTRRPKEPYPRFGQKHTAPFSTRTMSSPSPVMSATSTDCSAPARSTASSGACWLRRSGSHPDSPPKRCQTTSSVMLTSKSASPSPSRSMLRALGSLRATAGTCLNACGPAHCRVSGSRTE